MWKIDATFKHSECAIITDFDEKSNTSTPVAAVYGETNEEATERAHLFLQSKYMLKALEKLDSRIKSGDIFVGALLATDIDLIIRLAKGEE